MLILVLTSVSVFSSIFKPNEIRGRAGRCQGNFSFSRASVVVSPLVNDLREVSMIISWK